MMPLVATSFGGVSGALGDPGSIYSNVGSNLGNSWIAGLSPDQGPSRPSAYLNYILFDKDYVPIGGQSVPVPGTPNAPQLFSIPTITAPELGYVFIYLSYDNAAGGDVYFDDLKITVQESPVIEVSNYYPFGMVSYTWLRPGETDNAYLFQGKELIAQTGWHDFGSRMYWSDLGRWFGKDPKNQFASPYLAMGNAPMMGRDPNGEWFVVDDLAAMFAGAVSNVVNNWGKIKGTHGWFGKLLEYGGAGAAGAEVSLYAGPEAGFAVAGALTVAVDDANGYKKGWDWKSFVNGGMAALDGNEAGDEIISKVGENGDGLERSVFDKFEKADVAHKGFLDKLVKSDNPAWKLLRDGLKGGRNELLKSYAKTGSFSQWDKSFVSGFIGASVGKSIELSEEGFPNKIMGKLFENHVTEIAKGLYGISDEYDLSDFFQKDLINSVGTNWLGTQLNLRILPIKMLDGSFAF